MKKLVFVLAMMFATAIFVQAQETAEATFNLSMTVDKYIEATPGPLYWNVGTTDHNNGRNVEEIYGNFDEWNLAYSNCPFRVDIEGNNPAGQGKPRFARLETGAKANGYDILPTLYKIYVHTNDEAKYLSGAGTMVQQAGEFPIYGVFDEAPHNGQVKMDMRVFINTALATDPGAGGTKKTVIDPNYTWDQSADAGEYTCQMTVTLTAL